LPKQPINEEISSYNRRAFPDITAKPGGITAETNSHNFKACLKAPKYHPAKDGGLFLYFLV
jgi:hypothetical protein